MSPLLGIGMIAFAVIAGWRAYTNDAEARAAHKRYLIVQGAHALSGKFAAGHAS